MKLNQLYEDAFSYVEDGLLLRMIKQEDSEALLKIYGEEEIYKFRPGLPRKSEALIKKLIQRFHKEMESRTAIYLAICDANETCGVIGVLEIFNIEPRIEKVEIGYTIALHKQGMGYGSKAVGLLTKYLLKECEVNRVTATVHLDNKSSQRLLQRNGFTQEGIARQGAFWQGIGYVDIYCYSKLKKDI